MAEERKDEAPVQSSGYVSMGMGDHVVVQQSDGNWKPGEIVDCFQVYTVLFADGSHSTLDKKTFTLQRVTPLRSISPGQDVLVPVSSEDVRCGRFMSR